MAIKVIFFGTPEFAVPTLEMLIAHSGFEVLGVVSQPDKRRGRGNQLTPSPVKAVALTHQLPVWQPEKIKKDPSTLKYLREAQADVFVVVAYGQILSQKILAIPKLACVNVHGSILPEYRGAAPIQWCLYHGKNLTGITTMLMDAGMDTGAMLLKVETPIDLLDNAENLGNKLAVAGADLLITTLLNLQNQDIQAIPQDASLATYAPLITKDDYILNWQRSPFELHNQIRGFYPDCVSTFRGNPLKILTSFPLEPTYFEQLPAKLKSLSQQYFNLSGISGKPGEIMSICKGIGPLIQTGNGLLLIREVQPASKRAQSAWDWLNGARIRIGEMMGNRGIGE